jgi:hypothetical protein
MRHVVTFSIHLPMYSSYKTIIKISNELGIQCLQDKLGMISNLFYVG